MARTKPLSKALELATYAEQNRVTFQLLAPGSATEVLAEPVEIPISIVYRLYFLARAFDGQAIKQIKPGAMARVDYFKLQLLIGELELVGKVVSDPVSMHYLELLLPQLNVSRANPGCSLLVTT